jgi:hypothetical protein
MFTVTNPAASHLAQRLANGSTLATRTFTFAREDHGWRLRLSDRLTGDVMIRHDDKVVMVLDNEIASRLANRRLDLEATESGPRLRMPQNRPLSKEFLPDREMDE